jgi:nucleotide-binding universal stress UspA family protein
VVEKTIVAVDGEPASSAALDWAIRRAQTISTDLEITTVVARRGVFHDEVHYNQAVPREALLLKAAEEARAALRGRGVSTELRWGEPADELIAASRKADLLVLGANKLSAIVGIAHGSLPLQMAGHAQCTVVVVPAKWKPGTRKVVAGWSDDPTADAALEFAAREAARQGVDLTIVHTWSPPACGALSDIDSADTMAVQVAAHRSVFVAAARRIQREFPNLSITERMHAGPTAAAIIKAATGASLVVIGSRGRGPVSSFLLGSVSQGVLIHMPAPVAVIASRKPIDVYPELVDEYI